jgi:hypothetical protein
MMCTLQRAEPANPKKTEITIETTIIANLKSLFSHPTHSHKLGQLSGVLIVPHSSPSVSRVENTLTVQIVSSDMMNMRNELWLWIPTQLLIHGQWWS